MARCQVLTESFAVLTQGRREPVSGCFEVLGCGQRVLGTRLVLFERLEQIADRGGQDALGVFECDDFCGLVGELRSDLGG